VSIPATAIFVRGLLAVMEKSGFISE